MKSVAQRLLQLSPQGRRSAAWLGRASPDACVAPRPHAPQQEPQQEPQQHRLLQNQERPAEAGPGQIRINQHHQSGSFAASGLRAISISASCRADDSKQEPAPPGEGDHDGDPHPYFPRLSQQNPIQARYEAAEVAKAFDGLLVAPWFTLYDSPVDVVLNQAKRPLRQLHSVLFQPVLKRMAAIAEDMVTNEIDGSFEAQEFLEGASTAIQAIFDAWSARDWAMLRQVCTSRMVDRMQIALGELESDHGLQLSSISVQDFGMPLRLASVNLWTAAHVAKFDPAWPEEAAASAPTASRSWLVATVAVPDAAIDVVYKDAKTGEEQPARTLYRSGSFLFARGPLPRGFSSQVNLPWRLMSVW